MGHLFCQRIGGSDFEPKDKRLKSRKLALLFRSCPQLHVPAGAARGVPEGPDAPLPGRAFYPAHSRQVDSAASELLPEEDFLPSL